jgi:hypothetical protein
MASLGRVAGIAGITGGLATRGSTDKAWRLAFLAGLIGVPAVIAGFNADLARSDFSVSLPLIAIAGLLVGIGTTIGNGCTSGHGVCGMARLSIRSIVATLTFMIAGVATVFIVRHVAGGAL